MDDVSAQRPSSKPLHMKSGSDEGLWAETSAILYKSSISLQNTLKKIIVGTFASNIRLAYSSSCLKLQTSWAFRIHVVGTPSNFATLIRYSHTYAYVRTLIAHRRKIFACLIFVRLILPPKQLTKLFYRWKFPDLRYWTATNTGES